MRVAFTILVSGAILPTCGADAQGRSMLPPELGGLWASEASGGCAGAGERLSFSTSAAPPAGLRRITPTRWYVDLDEPDRLRQLDINKLSPTRLLIAERPLGEARFFIRCGEG